MGKTKLVIIGGVAGGATAAARARRLDEQAEIVLFERGEYISFANCGLPYYIGEVIKERDALFVTTPKKFKERYNIDIRNRAEVTALDRKSKKVEVKDLNTGETYWESYDKVILSPGAEPLRPPLEGIDLENIFSIRNIPDTDRIKAHVDSEGARSAVIVGGGYIGIEMAENLASRGVKTTVIEMLDQIMMPLDPEMAAMVQAHLTENGVTCELEKGVTSFSKNGDGIVVSTDAGDNIECDLVILSVGIRPENHLAKQAGLEISERGGIRVDGTMRTSDPDIYAVGDAVEVRDFITGMPTMTPLAGPANKQGRIAADNVMGRKSLFRGTLGTAVLKVFELTVTVTGANEKTLKANQIPYLKSYTHSVSHASYYPGAKNMSIKLLFSPGTGKILGAQIIGMDGVDKRIDVLATAIHGDMTVHDLEELELAYAPPYSSAKDPVNVAGFVAANILKGDVITTFWNDLPSGDGDKTVIVDLRNKEEIEKFGMIDGAANIPLPELRSRLGELDPEKLYIPYCRVGMRSYLGYRILSQNGFRVKNLSGGYMTYLGAHARSVKGM
ncbi:MAG: FAD-dependent oxidoreductase [Deltaproteobacteria bacterium]|nr:FAD-dependent oxidoreductase [Deltaproteobacteria bacterium]